MRPLPTRPPRGFHPRDVTPPPLPPGPWQITALALDVAGTCNLACRYCAEAATQPRRNPMGEDALREAWAFLFPDGCPDRSTSLRLGSGEPLLAWPRLQQLHALTAAGPYRPEVFLTTNGTLIDPPVEDWLVASGWHIKVSLDGPAEIQDAWRVRPDGQGTYTTVARTVANLARRMPDRLSVSAVLCRGTDPATVFWAIAQLGVRRIELVPVADHTEAHLPDAADIGRYDAFVRDYANRYLHCLPAGGLPSLVRFVNRVRRVMGYDNLRIPCGAGRSFLGVDAGGDLYPCFRFLGIRSYRLGRLDAGLDPEAVAAFGRAAGREYPDRFTCRTCWAAPLCGGPCFAVAELLGPGDGQPPALHCEYVLADARAAVWLIRRIRRRNPEWLLHFLPLKIGAE
jgi:uncharacterized protein